eukprot:m.504565 g.504565  ORF g.504565 m.504565 type:complete len:117 (-) comp57355_c0_seq10:2261-2611(-)
MRLHTLTTSNSFLCVSRVLQLIRLRENKLYLHVTPSLRRRPLQKKQCILKIGLFENTSREEVEESSAHIHMEHCKPVNLRVICVPEANGAEDWEFSREETVHPAESKLQILNPQRL